MKMKKYSIAAIVLTAAMTLSLSGCGNGADYGKYSSAYKKVTANGGMEAKFSVSLKMDGETSNSTGTFKLDTSDGNNVLYYEMTVDGNKVTQFSDGEYLYTESDGHKTKYALNSKPSASSDKPEAQAKDSGSEFNTENFLSDFSGFLEAGKIKEMGLLSPIEQAAVSSIKSETSGGKTVYTLGFSESLVKKYLNIMIENQTSKSGSDALQIDELKDFKYTAEEKNGIITGTTYSGVLKVKVPASLMSSGNAAEYDMTLSIDIDFVNPGEAVSISLPSTDGYEQVS